MICTRPASLTESDNVSGDVTETYIQIVTSGGRRIPVHANILASASTVFESLIDRPRKHRSSEKSIPILGVPCDAVEVFVGFLYSGKYTEEDIEKHGIHLLALSHVYLIPQLKSRCTKALIERLTIDNVIDALQLARLCDAPDLYLKCMKLVSNSFKAVEETEGWKFLQNHDPFLELEILQFIDETESRRKKIRRKRKEQSIYFELSEAMDCLEHICTEGCINVGPFDKEPMKNRAPCNKFSTCQGLQLSIQHFVNCKKRINEGCVRCKRMWQLFKLHASICESPGSSCRVPLCRRFKMRGGEEMKNKKEEIRWELLVKKVVLAKATSSLLLPKRKRVEEESTTEIAKAYSLLSLATNFPNLNLSATVDCCPWDGILCDDKRDRVIRLSIPERGLWGAIPSSLQNLTSLSFLNLSYNFLSGPLPDGLFSSFNNLHTIDLSYNRLSGYLPDTLPSTLQLLDFSSNQFNGRTQTASLQSLHSLIAFNISNNNFTGSIPPSICRASPALVVLDFSLNDFTGNIPQGFGACSNLQILSLGFNSLTGEIPTDINGVLYLQHLLLPGNSLTGEIRENITNLTNLRSLILFGNMLSGSIPHSIGKLSMLEKLELHINRLNGTLPLSLMNCTKLQLLNLRVNSLGGRLSDFDFSNFTQLSILDFGKNQFSRVLPKSLFSCKSLTAIRLATNKLDGEISPSILELSSLSFLSLSNNTFRNITQALNILSSHEKPTTLILSKNIFNETLPAAGISGFLNLQIMGLGDCKLFGQFPIWMMSLTNLQVFDLSQNNINGVIPGWIQTLPNLFYLDLSNNSLSGGFPVELTRLPALASQQVLDQVNTSYLELPVFVAPQNASYLRYNQLSTLPALRCT
ncbi:hypothetical protein L1987_47444 [Smallanthus sonchifolius]|uniref:Uncharacterized protein n=1 Tax=Smallanthus sonchifolius TaxID=185202 RepID=A0ACB9G378_9ASTR|nr:hypothetical protein L1987_47444 [Smallanthus sonchifolius]